jgi:hypothetical protein
VFLLNRATIPADRSGPRFSRRWVRVAALSFQILFVGYTLFNSLHGEWQAYQTTRVHPKRPPIYGLYDVEQFTLNGKQLPPLETDPARWRKLIAEFPGSITIKMMNGTTKGYPAAYNDDKKTLTLTDPKDEKVTYTLTYSRSGPNYLNLEGILANDRLSMLLVKADESKFLLLNRGFHWINELPFNR